MLLQVVLSSFLIMATDAGLRNRRVYGEVSGTLTEARVFPPDTVLTDFAAKGELTGMQYDAGKLAVNKKGYYFVYGQAWFAPMDSNPWYNRAAICINDVTFRLIQHGMDGRAAVGNLFSGGVVYLNQGDYISMKTVYQSNMWVSDSQSFFGAYKIR